MDTTNIVEIKGDSHYEIGLNHGRIFKKEINSVISDFYKLIKDKLPIFKYIPLKQLISFVGLLFSLKYPKKYLNEMKGISKGSGLGLNKIVFINSFMDFGSILASLKFVDIMSWGCSGFMSKDKNGKIVMAKTFDAPLPELLVKYGQLFYYNCTCLKSRFLVYGVPGVIAGDYVVIEGKTTGFFFYGGMAKSLRNYFKDQMTPIFYRELYENSQDISKTKKYLLENARPLTPYIGLISDGKNSFRVDIFSNHKNFYDYKGKAIIGTNHFLDEKMRERCYMKNYTAVGYYQDSIARKNVLDKLVKDEISIENVKDILTYQVVKGLGSISNAATTFAMIKTFNDNKIYATSERKIPATLKKEYKELDLAHYG